MTEICARVNGFFNKDIFFVEVTIFTYCTNVCVCVCHIYIYVCVQVFSMYTYTYVFISQFNRKCTLN